MELKSFQTPILIATSNRRKNTTYVKLEENKKWRNPKESENVFSLLMLHIEEHRNNILKPYYIILSNL